MIPSSVRSIKERKLELITIMEAMRFEFGTNYTVKWLASIKTKALRNKTVLISGETLDTVQDCLYL